MDACQHQPNRPVWNCTECGKTWPCEAAREYLTATTGDSLQLAITMWTYFDEYAIDKGMSPIATAHQRFVGWTRSPRT